MWIETRMGWCEHRPLRNSFASNGECGLKRPSEPVTPCAFRNSFASNGECGLKLVRSGDMHTVSWQFIRQQWRMWIETPLIAHIFMADMEFIRQQWRMWIETLTCSI